jgi:putative flippase GtrA
MKFAQIRRFVGYACVGVAGTAVQYAVLSALVLVHACTAVVASALGAVAGAVVNYVLNYRLTFRATRSHREAAPRFFAVAAVGVVLNSALMYLLIHRFAIAWLLAQCITTACVLILTYSANSLWTFQTRRA